MNTAGIKRYYKKFGKDVIWTFAGQMIVMLILLIINKVVSTFMSVEDFGQYNLLRRSASVLSFTMLGGAGIALPRYLAMSRQNRQERDRYLLSLIVYVLFVSASVFCLCLLFGKWLAPVLTGDNEWSHYFILIAYSFATSVSSFVLAYYRGIGQFIRYNVLQILSQLLLLPPLAFVLHISISALYLVWAIIFSVLYLIVILLEQSKERFSFSVGKKELRPYVKEVSQYSFPRLCGDFFLFFTNAFPLLYLNARSSLSDVSFFSVGVSLLGIATPVFSVLGVILLPYVSSCLAEGKMREAKKNVNRLTFIYITLAVMLTLCFFVFMRQIICLFFDPKYLSTIETTRLLILALLPDALYLLYRNPIDAISKTPYNTIIMLVSLGVLVAAFFLSGTLKEYAIAYLLAALFKGIASTITWYILIKKNGQTEF